MMHIHYVILCATLTLDKNDLENARKSTFVHVSENADIFPTDPLFFGLADGPKLMAFSSMVK